jgi:glucose-1-phosphate adenylyltransferase
MDYRSLIEFHRQKGAWVTVGAAEVDWLEARHYGVLETDDQARIVNFVEKPRITDDEIGCSPTAQVSMGIYLFDVDFLSALLHNVDGKDFGHDLLPAALASRNVFAFNPASYEEKSFFWRDVGTLHSYWKTQMEWIKGQETEQSHPGSGSRHSPTREGERRDTRYLGGLDPLIWEKGIQTLPSRRVYGEVSDTVVHPSAFVFSTAEVSDSILMEGAVIYPGAQVRRAILDRNAVVQSFEEIGFDLEEDAKKHLVTPEGLVVVSRRQTDMLGADSRSLGGDTVESSMTIG